MSEIRMRRIYVDLTMHGQENQIHIFHRYRAQQYLIPHHQGTHIGITIFKSCFDWANVGDQMTSSIRQGHFFSASCIKLQLLADDLGDNKVNRAGVRNCFDFHRWKIRPFWIQQLKHGVDQSH